MTDDMCGSVKSLHQGSDEIGFNTEVKCPGPRPVRSTAVAAEIGRNHFKVCPKSRGKFGPLATRVTRTMQQHDRLSSTDGEVLATDAPDVDAGDAHVVLLVPSRRPNGRPRSRFQTTLDVGNDVIDMLDTD